MTGEVHGMIDVTSAAIPAVAERFRELGMEPTGLSGETFNAVVRSDYERWGELIRKKNIKAN